MPRQLTHDDWDRPRCSICVAGRDGALDLLRVEKLLADRSRMAAVAQKFALSYDALRRHWLGLSAERKNFLQRGRQLTKDALAAELAEEKLGLRACWRRFLTRGSRLWSTSARNRPHRR
jgi:hypothetical protein